MHILLQKVAHVPNNAYFCSMKVVHVSLYEPYNGQREFYFGSIKAIYDHIPKECVGIAYTSLCTQLRGKVVYRNKMCVINVGELLQHPQTNKQQYK